MRAAFGLPWRRRPRRRTASGKRVCEHQHGLGAARRPDTERDSMDYKEEPPTRPGSRDVWEDSSSHGSFALPPVSPTDKEQDPALNAMPLASAAPPRLAAAPALRGDQTTGHGAMGPADPESVPTPCRARRLAGGHNLSAPDRQLGALGSDAGAGEDGRDRECTPPPVPAPLPQSDGGSGFGHESGSAPTALSAGTSAPPSPPTADAHASRPALPECAISVTECATSVTESAVSAARRPLQQPADDAELHPPPSRGDGSGTAPALARGDLVPVFNVASSPTADHDSTAHPFPGTERSISDEVRQSTVSDGARGTSIPDWVRQSTMPEGALRSPYELRRGSKPGDKQCYLHLDPASFNVRGAAYMSDGRKAPSAGGASELLAVELFRAKEVVEDVGTRPGAPSHTLRHRTSSSLESILVINMILPASSGVFQLALYFGILAEGASGAPHALLDTLRRPETDDAWRNRRVKLIPGIETGPWLIKKVVGHTPAILGKSLAQRFHTVSGIFQVSVDCNSSPAAGRIVSMVKSQCRHLAVDLGFLLEPQAPAEMPERVLGCVRVSHCSLGNAAVPEYQRA